MARPGRKPLPYPTVPLSVRVPLATAEELAAIQDRTGETKTDIMQRLIAREAEARKGEVPDE